MDKREMIISVLAPFTTTAELGGYNDLYFNFDALAEQAIVIECEVEHKIIGMMTRFKETRISYNGQVFYRDIGHHGTPGKAIAIILPLGEG